MPRVARALVACAVLLSIVGLAPSGSGAAAPRLDRPNLDWPDLDWKACGGAECATLRVPADHDVPDGATLDVAVARLRATDAERRTGVLVVNPGGPGVSGVDRIESFGSGLPTELRKRFDLVTFDPRGVGGSAAVDCETSIDGVFDASFSPDTAAQRTELVDAVQDVADRCAQRNGDLLDQVSTVDTARDLDVLRQALGVRRLNFLGFSYGTYLGALYASLYPERVRALVLDGAVDPDADALESVLLQARGFESNLDAFLADCATRERCPFRRDGGTAAAYDALRERIAEAPLATDGARGRTLNETRFDAAVLQLLYGGRQLWNELARALDEADRGDGARLLAIADMFVGRQPGGRDDGTVEAFWAISCLDGPVVDGVDAMTAIETQVRREAPRLGGFVVNFSLPCAVWPSRATEARPSIAGAAPGALVVSSARDPATPLVSAEQLASTLGGAALVVGPGDRHTAFGAGNPCVDDAVLDYLRAPRGDRARVTHC